MMERGKFNPHDQYEYGHGLLDEKDSLDMPLKKEEDTTLSERFNSLLGKQLLLVNIGDKVLPIEQEKIRILVTQFDMARRSIFYRNVFLRAYFSWKHQLQITRAKNGKASEQAHSISAGYPRSNPNYLGYQGYEDLEKEEKGILGKLFSPKEQQPQMR